MVRGSGSDGTKLVTLSVAVLLIGSVAIAIVPTASAQENTCVTVPDPSGGQQSSGSKEICTDDIPDPDGICDLLGGTIPPCGPVPGPGPDIESIDVYVFDSLNEGIGTGCAVSGTEQSDSEAVFDTYYDYCLEAQGTCTVTTHTEQTTEITWWTLLFIGQVQVDTTVDVHTEISCEGSYTMTMEHYGGVGLRDVVATEETSGSSESNQESVSKESCDYLGDGPVGTNSCITTFEGEWETGKSVDGEVDQASGLNICKRYSVHNELTVSVNGLLATSGNTNACFDATDTAVESYHFG